MAEQSLSTEIVGEPLLRVEGITKLFPVSGSLFGKKNYVCAVDNVSFSMAKGDALALVGESGCGKSTLGRLILALLKPTSGQILFKGKNIWNMSKSEFKWFRRNAQIVQQDPYQTLNPMRTVFQSLVPPLSHYKVVNKKEEMRERVAELLESVGLCPPQDFFDRYPSRLSGGQMQRISIARAVSVNPLLLIADEAVSMIDASLRIEVLNLLLDLKKRLGMTCVLITHDFGVARYFAKGGKVMVMYLGSIVEAGPTEDVILKPKHPYTETLLASVPLPDPKLTRSKGLPPLRSVEIPKLTNVPSGCKFHPRCPYAEDICAKKVPELKTVYKQHVVACHRLS